MFIYTYICCFAIIFPTCEIRRNVSQLRSSVNVKGKTQNLVFRHYICIIYSNGSL